MPKESDDSSYEARRYCTNAFVSIAKSSWLELLLMSNKIPAVVVLTWKPEINPDFKEAEFDSIARQRWREGFIDVTWRFSGKRYKRGDFVIVLRQGVQPGLVALGHVVDECPNELSTEGPHSTKIRLVSMRDSLEEPFLTRKALLFIGFRKTAVDTQSSGAILLEAGEVSALQDHLVSVQNKDLRSLCVGNYSA